MEKQIDLEKTMQMVEPDLPKLEQLSEKDFNADVVKSELEKLSKDELVELQVNMFAQYHEMARTIVEMAAAIKLALRSKERATG